MSALTLAGLLLGLAVTLAGSVTDALLTLDRDTEPVPLVSRLRRGTGGRPRHRSTAPLPAAR